MQTSAAFDEGGARGLLLNHLSVQSESTLLFDSLDVVDELSKEDIPAVDVPFAELSGIIQGRGGGWHCTGELWQDIC